LENPCAARNAFAYRSLVGWNGSDLIEGEWYQPHTAAGRAGEFQAHRATNCHYDPNPRAVKARRSVSERTERDRTGSDYEAGTGRPLARRRISESQQVLGRERGGVCRQRNMVPKQQTRCGQ